MFGIEIFILLVKICVAVSITLYNKINVIKLKKVI
jgi:hypothetical protein